MGRPVRRMELSSVSHTTSQSSPRLSQKRMKSNMKSSGVHTSNGGRFQALHPLGSVAVPVYFSFPGGGALVIIVGVSVVVVAAAAAVVVVAAVAVAVVVAFNESAAAAEAAAAGAASTKTP